MSDQDWNTPQDPNAGQGWDTPPPAGQQPPPPNPAGDPGQAPGGNPPPPQWGQQAPQPGQQVPGQPPQQWGQQAPPPGQPAGGQWGQQPQSQPPGQPQQQWGQQPQQSGGIDPPVAGILAYLFGWIGGLVIYLVNKDHLSRFHGAQSILLNIAAVVVYVGIFILSTVLTLIADFFGFLFIFVPFLGLGFFGLAIYLMVKAYQGEKVMLPIIGPMADSWASK